MATMNTTHDEKIMNFDVAEGYEAFMKLVNEDEIAEMCKWLESEGYEAFMKLFNEDEIAEMCKCLECEFGYDYECDYDYSWNTLKEISEGIVMDYVKEWFVQNI